MERHADIEMTVIEEEDFTHSSLEQKLACQGRHLGKHQGQCSETVGMGKSRASTFIIASVGRKG